MGGEDIVLKTIQEDFPARQQAPVICIVKKRTSCCVCTLSLQLYHSPGCKGIHQCQVQPGEGRHISPDKK